MRLLLVALLLIMASGAGLQATAWADDGDAGFFLPCSFFDTKYEDNDDIGSAWPLLVPFQQDNIRVCLNDDDFYSFSVAQGTTLQIEAQFTDANGDVDLYLYNGANALVASALSFTDNEKITHAAATSGIYKLRVDLFDDADGFGNLYDLSIDANCRPAGVSGDTYTDRLENQMPIPDSPSPGMSNCIRILDSNVINDLQVGLDIKHTWVGDLKVELIHEDTGTTVMLIDRPGVPASTLGCSGNNIVVTLSDGAAFAVEDKCNPGVPTISGTQRPNEALSAFDGESIAGVWRIRISDNVGLDTGGLNAWTLIPSLKPLATSTPTVTRTPTSTRTPTVTPTDVNTPTPTRTPTSTVPPTATVTATLEKAAGDVNDDGSVNSIDAALILQLTAGLVGSLLNEPSADVNGDGTINSIDAALVLQFTAGLIPSLPV